MLWVKGIASQELVSTTISSILGTSKILRAVRIETPAPRGEAACFQGHPRLPVGNRFAPKCEAKAWAFSGFSKSRTPSSQRKGVRERRCR
jgi:hypothetical protein